MKIVELTDAEAHLISEVFEATAYKGAVESAVYEVAENCGALEMVGTDNYEALLESIFNKTK